VAVAELSLRAGSDALVPPPTQTNEGDASDKEKKDHCADGNTDNYRGREPRVVVVLIICFRVDDADWAVSEHGIVQAEQSSRGGLLLASGRKGGKDWSVLA